MRSSTRSSRVSSVIIVSPCDKDLPQPPRIADRQATRSQNWKRDMNIGLVNTESSSMRRPYMYSKLQ